jgi:hypothetical protein
MKIEVLDNSRYEEYEIFLFSYENSLFYHSTKYKEFLEDLLGCESKYLLAYDNCKIVAVLPLMIKNGGLGKVVNSLPYYGSNGGVIGQAGIASKSLLEEYDNIAKQKDILSSTIVENPLDKQKILPLHNSTDMRIGQFTNIECDNNFEEETFKRISGNRRNEIRRAQKHGVIVTEENDQLDFIRLVHQDEMKKNNRKYKTDEFFNRVKNYFIKGVDYKVFIAHYEQKPIAGLLMFYFNKIAEYFTPVVLQEARIYQPMSLILYHVFLDAMKQGYKMINWGGTWVSQEGVYRFKNQMGAKDHPYCYYTQINNPDILQKDPADILLMYPEFYVFNFNKR